jgi:DNA-binding transcriptional MerR regulator
VRTDELIRRVTGLSVEVLDAIEAAGYVSPDRLAGGSDPRWWSESDLHKVRDILRFRRRGVDLEEAYRRAREDRFFGLCPCDWR